MNWRRICAVMKVRIATAAVLSGFIFIIAGCSLHTNEDSEQSEKNEQTEENGFSEENTLDEAEETETEADVKSADMYMEEKDLREHIIVLKKKEYINGKLRGEYEYDEKGHLIRYTHYHDDDVLDLCFEFAYDEMGNLIKESSSTEGYVTEYEYEYASETAGRIRSTVIGDVEILEKSLQTTIEVESWSRVRTWDLKYPYFSGDEVVLLREINDQIYEWVRDRNMDDSEELYYTELTYEITYMDERLISILFEGEGGGSSYYGYSHGMSFDLETGKLLSLTDFYEWPEWKDLMQNAMEQGQLSTQILRGYMELEEDENREYLEEYFITHAYPSCREDSYVKWEYKKDDLEEQGEEKTPLMSGEEFDKITECLDEQVPEIWSEWAYFYVSEDFSEVLWYDLVQGMDSEYPVLYLDEWRNSDFYPKLEK